MKEMMNAERRNDELKQKAFVFQFIAQRSYFIVFLYPVYPVYPCKFPSFALSPSSLSRKADNSGASGALKRRGSPVRG